MLACVCMSCTSMQLDGEAASLCGGTAAASYAGLRDGNHSFTACASTTSASNSSSSPSPTPTCATYAWDVG
jgi:hypothetical protein